MANTNEMFDELLTKKESYFVPEKSSSKPKVVPNVRGEFFGHLQGATMKEVSWAREGMKFKAVVYNYLFEVDKANSGQLYHYTTYKTGEKAVAEGKDYIGRVYRSGGIFRFLEPQEGDDLVSNAEGNKSYLRFCETLGMKIDRKKVNVEVVDMEVKVLPSLDTTEINGKPEIAVVDKGKPYTSKDGKERTPYLVKFIKTWEEGKEKDADIPF